MFRVSSKLKELKKVIREFSKNNFSDLEKRVEEAYVKVMDIQKCLLSSPNQSFALEEIEAHRCWQVLVLAEKAFFNQRSRVC